MEKTKKQILKESWISGLVIGAWFGALSGICGGLLGGKSFDPIVGSIIFAISTLLSTRELWIRKTYPGIYE